MSRIFRSLASVFAVSLHTSLVLFALASFATAQKPGTHERTLESSKKTREYLLHVPRGYKAEQKKALPLVVMLHGRTSDGRAAASAYYGWTALADKESFFAVFPTALGSPTSWEGGWSGKPTADSIFLAELIEALSAELRIDRDRVYMCGHSSGGFMSYSFATTHSNLVAAIGPVAGLRVGAGEPSSPVAVISFHGMADDIVAYDKEHGKAAAFKGMPSAIESAAFFATHNRCAEVVRTDIADGKVHVDTWAEGEDGSEVVLYSIEGGGHGWPRGEAKTVAATGLIWEFFKAHPRIYGRVPADRELARLLRAILEPGPLEQVDAELFEKVIARVGEDAALRSQAVDMCKLITKSEEASEKARALAQQYVEESREAQRESKSGK